MSSMLTSFTGGLSIGLSSGADYATALANNYAKEYNAITAEYAAEVATAKADTFRQLGETEKAEVLQTYQALQSQQRAEYGAAGVNVNVGSALTQQVATAKQGVYEAQKAQYERDMQAWEMDVEAQSQLMTAEMNRAAKANPWLPAVTSAVSGVSSLYGTYGSWQKQTTSQVSQSSSIISSRV